MLRKVLALLAVAGAVGAAPGIARAAVPASVTLPPVAAAHVPGQQVVQDSGTLIIA